MAQTRTPHGALLDAARTALGISQREASRRAGISEGRWRQVVTGVQKAGGVDVPVNPRPETLVAMARAVELEPVDVLVAAGVDVTGLHLEQPAELPTRTPSPGAAAEARVSLLERRLAQVEERLGEIEESVLSLTAGSGKSQTRLHDLASAARPGAPADVRRDAEHDEQLHGSQDQGVEDVEPR